MATYKILRDNAPYYRIEVSFGDQVFVQDIIVSSPTPEQDFQRYADTYEADWAAQQSRAE